MPSPAKAILSLVDLVAFACQAHPLTLFLVGWSITQALYGLGILTPLDWWGDREIPR